VGNQAGRDFTGSTNAVAVGYGAMRLATGGDNVSIGTESLNGLTTGTNNVAIGTYAGTTNVTTGSGNVFIGDRVYPSTNVSNKLYIDNAYSASDKPLIYGDFSTDALTINGTLTAGASTVAYLNVLKVSDDEGGEIAIQYGDADGYWIIDEASPAAGPERLRMYPSNLGETYGMTLTVDGKVGIGTGAPSQRLEVNGTAKAKNLARDVITITADRTVASTDAWIIVNNAAKTFITLPNASDWTGRELMFKTIQAFAVESVGNNVIPLAGGTADFRILPATDGAWATLVSDGANWIIMQSGQ
jgi:hypothetical protein